MSEAAADAKVQTEASLMSRLNQLAAEINASGRLTSIIDSAGDGVTSERQQARQQQHRAASQMEAMDIGPAWDARGPLTLRLSPSLDQETWIPRKRTRKEIPAFDTFFMERHLSPMPQRPKGKVRICKLGKEAMQPMD